MTERVVLIGATGVFGARLARHLAGSSDFELVLAARRRTPLEALARELGGVEIAVFDRDSPDAVAALQPWAVVDAAGPFQGASYELARATLAAGANYIDFADGRAFVRGFPSALSTAARAAGCIAMTGVSSTPALSNAALDVITAGWSRVDGVDIAISPGARAPQGRSVVKAILSYVGQPVQVFIDGGWRTEAGWGRLRLKHFPGLGGRWTSLCETPDQDLIPERFKVARRAVFRAGLELSVLHLGLWTLSWIVRLRLIRSLAPVAAPLSAAAGWVARLGSDRGGMIVEAKGLDANGERRIARWSLWAEANAGPTVPTATAAAILRKLKNGEFVENGAFICVGMVGLDEILAELTRLPIHTRIDRGEPDATGLFRRVMGSGFDDLPEPVRRLHRGDREEAFHGRGRARGSRALLPRLARWLTGLPEPGAYPVVVKFTPDAKGEGWTRHFGRYSFRSRLRDLPGVGEFEEVFGLFRFIFEAEARTCGFRWRFRGWRLGRLPLPACLAPRMSAKVMGREDDYRFSVAVAHPLTGILFAYAGSLDRWIAGTTIPKAGLS